jgi:histidinol-phosphate aminotransferase
MNILSQNAALAAMDYADDILAHNIPPTLAARQHFMDALKDVPNLTVYPSATNFVLVRVPDGPAMVKALHDADICVRSYKAADLKNCLRITITTDDVVRRVVAVMTEEAKKYA